jgi:phosphohistidine phosphatase
MRRLLLLRHAKADPRDRGAARDHQRALAERGRDDAPRIGRYLASESIIPELALVSDSARTQETFALVQLALGRPIELRLEPAMYEADWSDLLTLVRATEASVTTLLLIGHNPDLAYLAGALAGSGDRHATAKLRAKFPTAALAIIDFDGPDWSDVGAGRGRLERFVTPAGLGADGDE